jgi:hypothetical protein
MQVRRDDRPGVGAPGRSGNGNWKGNCRDQAERRVDTVRQHRLRAARRPWGANRFAKDPAPDKSPEGDRSFGERQKEPGPYALATMVKHLRARYGTGRDEELDFIINALDPATPSDWKLEFKRRKGRHTNVDDLHLFSEYLDFRKAYEAQGKKQAHKRAVTDLATKYGREFNAMEAAIRRGRKMMGR